MASNFEEEFPGIDVELNGPEEEIPQPSCSGSSESISDEVVELSGSRHGPRTSMPIDIMRPRGTSPFAFEHSPPMVSFTYTDWQRLIRLLSTGYFSILESNALGRHHYLMGVTMLPGIDVHRGPVDNEPEVSAFLRALSVVQDMFPKNCEEASK